MNRIRSAKITKTSVDGLKAGQTLKDTELRGFGVRRQLGAPRSRRRFACFVARAAGSSRSDPSPQPKRPVNRFSPIRVDG